MRYKLTIAYDGTNYYGFQRQSTLPTIQEEIEKVLNKILQEDITITASGRTDAGVHALGQVAHFDTTKEITNLKKFIYGINSLLPKSIDILNCEKVDENFHARYSSKLKTYVYKIYLSKGNEPLKRNYYHICGYDLDFEKMQQACNKFVGEHDFKAFSVENPKLKSTTRIVTDCHLERDGNEIDLIITGNGFLHNMVRSIAGTIIDVARGRFDVEYIDKIFESKDHTKAGKTLEGCGLYLKSVEYIQES